MQILIDSTLSLSQVTMADAPLLVKHLNHEKIFENTLMIPSPYTMNDAGWFITFVEERKQRYGRLNDWAIRDENGQLIGGVGFQVEHGIHSHKDAIGYWLAAPYWGKGISTKVVKVVTNIGFQEFGLRRIEAPIFPHNIASARVLEKNGFESEGILKNYHLKKNQPIDVKMYAKIN
ncbi:MAG: GNAT family protein [Bacteroidota bacterium]